MTPGSDVLIHTVGTFGISSASCCWSRVAGATGRLAHHQVSSITTTWHMLVADDCVLECICFVLCTTCGASSVLGKTAGGDNLVWVGFEILLRSHSRGCSTSANSTSDNSTSQLAEVEIGRSRNWPKSKLAEVGIGRSRNWPKSNRWCLLCFLLSLFLFFFCFVFTFLCFFLVLTHLSLHFVFVLFLFSSPKT